MNATTSDPAPSGDSPTIDVVICAYTEDRWSDLVNAVSSVSKQSSPAQRTILVIDHNNELLERCRAQFRADAVDVMANRYGRGLSGGRNTGVEASTAEVVAFLDDDATADDDWLLQFRASFAQPGVVGVGGRIEPVWVGGEPPWFPEEFGWVVGCTYRGMPTTTTPIRNPIGASMAFTVEALQAGGGFDAALGRIGTKPVGCEETELSIRVRRHFGPDAIVYNPDSVVQHHVSPDRGTVRYFLTRGWSEGRSKAAVSARTGADEALESERRYVTTTLPQGVLRGLRQPISGWSQAGMIVAGLAVTGLGYVTGRLRRDRDVVAAE
ncbi:MAG: glycosyltransferase [Actinomycetota bacterium]